VNDITLNTANATLARKGKITLKANVLPSDATNKKVTWITSNKKVATVNAKGVVTGVGGGTCVVTARAKDGGFVARATITVTPIYETAIKLNKTSVRLAKGKAFQLKPTFTPKTTDFKTATYISDNPNIARVDAKGKITAGQTPGTATITAISANGKIAYCKVTVLP